MPDGRDFSEDDVLVHYHSARGACLPVLTRFCWDCQQLVDLLDQSSYSVSRISGDSRYGYEPCHNRCGG